MLLLTFYEENMRAVSGRDTVSVSAMLPSFSP